MSSRPLKRQKSGPVCIVCAVAATGRCAHCTDDFCAFHGGLHAVATVDATGHMSCAMTVACSHCNQQYCRGHRWGAHQGAFQNDTANHASCAASWQQCPHCAQNFCGAHSTGNHQNGYQNDGAAHSSCAASWQQCPHCAQNFCGAHSTGNHQNGYQDDGAAHSSCAASWQQCTHCTLDFCKAHSIANHLNAYQPDDANHASCAASLKQCTHCTKSYCGTHSVHLEITAAACNDKTCSNMLAKCAVCAKEYCHNCKGTYMVRDLCKTDLTASAKTKSVGDIHVKYEKVPGYKNAIERITEVDGPIKSTGSADRGTPPPPLCSGKTQKTDDIAELKQYDRGHLIALELDGADDVYCIVPMIRQFNQSGAWRQMEIAVGGLLGGKDLDDWDGGKVPADTSATPTNVDLSLRQSNTVNNTKWHMEVQVFYEDVYGDPRVPVWYYVRILYNKKVWTHFSFANRCGKTKTVPGTDESVQFWAAKEIYDSLNKTKRDQVVDQDLKDLYTDHALDELRPNQLLEFMRDVNVKANDAVFPLLVVETEGPSKPYTADQRTILRKFNVWKNKGTLQSDVQKDDLFPGEKKDAHAVLDECGGRAAPEVDHILPSYQSGGNYYINARLVSFQHNHLYREKKTLGAQPVWNTLHDRYMAETLVFLHADKRVRYYDSQRAKEFVTEARFLNRIAINVTSDDVVDAKTPALNELQAVFDDDKMFDKNDNRNLLVSTAELPYSILGVKPLIGERQAFLRAADGIVKKYAIEAGLVKQYQSSRSSHDRAVQQVIDDVNHPVRKAVVARITGAKTTKNAQLPLCKPSDRLNLTQAGETGGVVNPAFELVTLSDAKREDSYDQLMKRWDKVKP